MHSATTKENTQRILVVGDAQDSPEMRALRVAFRKCDVRIATDGAAAIRIAESFEPDLILLDMIRGELDGAAVARTLKNGRTRARIIGIAASVEPNRHAVSHVDCDVVIAKPAFAAVIDILSKELGPSESTERSP
jgi:CheY-like chemotaxis protein